ncbi:MAG: hypothetical protein V3R37_06070 [Rhodospirillales bacterium]
MAESPIEAEVGEPVLSPVVTSLLSVMSQRRVVELRETQSTIIEEWGEGVTKAVEPVDISPVGIGPIGIG